MARTGGGHAAQGDPALSFTACLRDYRIALSLPVEVWCVPWAAMPIIEMAAWLPPSEQARLPTHPEARVRSLVGRALVRGVLSERLGLPPEALPIQYGERDKPYVPDQPWHFNLSHSGAYLLLALALAPVGVDIEQVRPERVRPALLQRVASVTERDWVGADARRFFQLWCAKEAALKALGLGVAHLEQVSLRGVAPGWNAQLAGHSLALEALSLAPDYVGAVSLAQSE